MIDVEFARQSSDGRMTLVLCNSTHTVRSLWAIMDCKSLDEAKKNLLERESIPKKNIGKHIGAWTVDTGADPIHIHGIKDWAKSNGIDHVIWTNLPPKFNEEERVPKVDELIDYLRGLKGSRRDHAEQYVRRAPRQIDTEFRREMEASFNWIAAD